MEQDELKFPAFRKCKTPSCEKRIPADAPWDYCFACFAENKRLRLADGAKANWATAKPLASSEASSIQHLVSDRVGLMRVIYESVSFAGITDRASIAATIYIDLTNVLRVREFRR